MRICHTTQSAQEIYGAERCLLAEATAQTRHGHDVTVLLCHETRLGPRQATLEQTLQQRGLRTVRVETASRMGFRLFRDWCRALRTIGPHVVHSHSMKTDVLSAPLCRLLGLPLVIELHGYLSPPDWRVRLYEALDRKTLHLAHAVLTLNQDYQQQALRSGLPKECVHLVPSGLDMDPLTEKLGTRDFRAGFAAETTPFVVGLIARLSPEKGPQLFLSALAWARARGVPVHGALFGQGPMEAQLRQQAAALHVPVTFFGYVDEIGDACLSLDVLLSCSHAEGLPQNLMEAMAFGVPVVATATAGCRQLIQDGETGLLVSVGQVEAMGRALCRLWQDPLLRKRLGQTAAVRVKERYSMQRWVQTVDAVYKQARALP